MLSSKKIAAVCLLFFLAGCFGQSALQKRYGAYKVGKPYKVGNIWYTPTTDLDYEEIGLASWYGPGFHRGKTANGATYNQKDMTAAHRTLPMPSVVRITNLRNGKSVEAVINDRGPFAGNRIIDASKTVAKELDFIRQGTAKVRVEFLLDETNALLKKLGEKPFSEEKFSKSTQSIPQEAPKTTAASGKIFIQAGNFSNPVNANRLSEKLKNIANTSIKNTSSATHSQYRVLLGPWNDRSAAQEALTQLRRIGHTDAIITSY
jgi:rare lipoprotein A